MKLTRSVKATLSHKDILGILAAYISEESGMTANPDDITLTFDEGRYVTAIAELEDDGVPAAKKTTRARRSKPAPEKEPEAEEPVTSDKKEPEPETPDEGEKEAPQETEAEEALSGEAPPETTEDSGVKDPETSQESDAPAEDTKPKLNFAKKAPPTDKPTGDKKLFKFKK